MMNKPYIKKSNLRTALLNYPLYFLLTIIIATCTIKPLKAQNEPQWVNVSPFTNNDGGVTGFFLNENEGWIWKGLRYKASVLYYTNDGAKTFEPIFQFDDTLTRFQALQMLTSKKGFARIMWENIYPPYDDSIFFVRTEDGGYSWNNVIFDTTFTDQFSNIGEFYFTDTLTGFNSRYKDFRGSIYKTIDGCITWIKTDVTGYNPEIGLDSSLSFYKFFFIDDLHGWAIGAYTLGRGGAIKTTDGGLTWQVINLQIASPWDIQFISANKGAILGISSYVSPMVFTENNFNSFSYVYSDWNSYVPQQPKTLCYQNDSTIWVSGYPNDFYRSVNSGETFELFESSTIIDGTISDINFYGNTGYAFGSNLLKFQDTTDVSLKNKLKSENITLFPNPTKNTALLYLSEKTSVHIFIYNFKGDIVTFYELHNSKQVTIDLQAEEPGIYFVKYVNKHGVTVSEKLIKIE